MDPEQQAHEQQDQADKKSRRKRSRWGAETEAGLKVLAGADVEQVQQPAEQQQPQQSTKATDDAEAGRKKRRSRWEPETETKPALIQGLQIALPPSIAALVDMHVDPKVMELQRQLNNVSIQDPSACSVLQKHHHQRVVKGFMFACQHSRATHRRTQAVFACQSQQCSSLPCSGIAAGIVSPLSSAGRFHPHVLVQTYNCMPARAWLSSKLLGMPCQWNDRHIRVHSGLAVLLFLQIPCCTCPSPQAGCACVHGHAFG